MPSFRAHLALLAALFLLCACSGAQMVGSPTFDEPAPSRDGEDPSLLDTSLFGSGSVAARDVMTAPGELPELRVAADDNKALPLKHTSVKATLAGFTASVEVAQTYTNPYKQPIEATYIFPLPENAAVHAMKIVIGDRTIEAVVKERAAARQTYETARSKGQTAALLEQERPNIFTQSVANIEPGKRIDVVIRYVQDLTYDAGQYEFVFPMVVGPRYIPGDATDKPSSGTGTYADTTSVPDASRITPPYLGKGERSGHDISIDVVASGQGVVSRFEVPTHDVAVESNADGSMHLTLADHATIPNRDFVLRYRVAGPKPTATLFASGRNEGAFSLVIQPPALDVDALVGRREFVFVVDVSGSMTGVPLGMCKVAMRAALAGMRPVDTFNVITFAGATAKLFKHPMPADESAILQAAAFVDRLSAGGSTEMANAIEEALRPEGAAGRNRYVFFMTDGEVGNDEEILRRTREFVTANEARGSRARVFGFGVGSSVNRHLLSGLADRGKGVTVYATNREDPERAVNRFYRYVDRAVLSKVRVDFGGIGAKEVYPKELPDLFASHPIIVHGRYKGALTGPIQVIAESKSGEVTIPVAVARAPMEDGWPVQELLWARSKIASLESSSWGDEDSRDPANEILKLGLEHHLVTAYTSFVAVDTTKRVGDGKPAHITQQVEVPEDVDGHAAGARTVDKAIDCTTCFTVPRSPSAGGPPTEMAASSPAYGYEFSEDPLTAGGFGPNDAQIRVRPGTAPALDPTLLAERNKLDMAIESQQLASAPRGPRGCNCGVVGDSSTGSRAAWAMILATVIFAGRRRIRRGPRVRR